MTQEREQSDLSESRFSELLLHTSRLLNNGNSSDEVVSEALDGIRNFFSYGSAFIYERDHTKTFHLKESSPVYEHDSLPNSFSLEDCLESDQINLIDESAVYQSDCESDYKDFLHKLCEFFTVQSLLTIFITNDKNEAIGCVGMADMRQHKPLQGLPLEWADTLLRIIAQRSRLRIYRQRLNYASNTLVNIMDHIGFDIYVNDFDTHEMLYANESMAAPYGGSSSIGKKTCHEWLYEGQSFECEYCPKHQLIDENGEPTKTYAWDYQRPFDKKWFRVISAAFQWTDGRLAVVVSSSDITDAKKNELLVYQMAHYDTLTGIPNRRKLEQDLEKALAKSTHNSPTNKNKKHAQFSPGIVGGFHHKNEEAVPNDEEKNVAVLFLDLDEFKQVNDTLGHSGGDALLKHIAQTFEESPLTAEHCYRYGGDEFVFLYDNTTREQARNLGNQILELLKKPFVFDNFTHICEGSIGVSVYPEDGSDYWELFDRADHAMYSQKVEKKKRSSIVAH